MQLVKKTRRNWECNECRNNIPKGTSMFRVYVHRWLTLVWCFKCSKPELEEKIETAKKSLTYFEFMKSDKPDSVYMSFKNSIEYFKDCLKIVGEKL